MASGSGTRRDSFSASLRRDDLVNSARTMNVNLGLWDKLYKLTLFLLVVAALAYGFFRWYLPLIQQNQRYRKEILTLDARIAEQEKLARQTRHSIDSLQNDPRTIERLAREKLGVAKSNEMVVRFETIGERKGNGGR
jgi:cell division protein FtsB